MIYIPCFGAKENQFLYFIATSISLQFFLALDLQLWYNKIVPTFAEIYTSILKENAIWLLLLKKFNEKRRNCKTFKSIANHADKSKCRGRKWHGYNQRGTSRPSLTDDRQKTGSRHNNWTSKWAFRLYIGPTMSWHLWL